MMLLPLALCAAGSAPASAGGNPKEKYPFDIAPGEAAYRLNDFSTQSGLQLLFGFEDMKGIPITPVRGKLKPFDALDRMIAGTKIRYEFINRRTVTLTLKPVQVAEAAQPMSSDEDHFRVTKRDRRAPDVEIEQVTVLSKYVSPLAETGSTLVTLNRTEIDALGAPNVPGVIRTLPQVFGGGPTEDTRRIGFEAGTNASHGSGINLRGLGAGSTLVLMNSRRLPGSGTEAVFVDVSNLPLAAVERIDILPDSSSTHYGADAVGGVVNFVMRDRFDGAQSEVHYGTATRGQLNENYVSQIIGGHTDRWRGLVALDFYSRDNLPAANRARARSDLTEFGGGNFDIPQSNPGNIILAGKTWAIPRGQDGSSLKPSDFQPGTQNLQNQYDSHDVLPSQQRWSAFATGRHTATDRLSLFADLLAGQRDVRNFGGGQRATFSVPVSNPFYVNPTGVPGPVTMAYNFLDDLGPLISDIRVNTFDVASGFEMRLGSRWSLTGTVGHASEKIDSSLQNVLDAVEFSKALTQTDPAKAFNPFGDGTFTNADVLAPLRTTLVFNSRSSVRSGGFVASGPIVDLPAGEMTLAVGGDAREQSFESVARAYATATPDVSDSSRSIQSAFAELKVPIVSRVNRSRGIESLTFSMAQRYENYSDFGDNLAARLGLAWEPWRGITLRGTYAESFRPPGLLDMNESINAYAFVPLADPTTGGPSNVMVWTGKNRDLHEENARSWTAALELEPANIPGTALALTYFNTEFTDRLRQPRLTPDLLANPSLMALVTRDPSAEYRADVCSRSPKAIPLNDCFNTPIAAIADLRVRNDATVLTRGIDLLGRYSKHTRFGRFSFGLNGTYILEFSEAQTSDLPLLDKVSTPNYPVNLRFRSSTGWQRNGAEVIAYVNYLNNYRDVPSVPGLRVNSWTTVDLHAAYTRRSTGQSLLGDTTFALGVENLFDTDPPFLNNFIVGMGYDQENGDLTGRIVSLTVRKKW